MTSRTDEPVGLILDPVFERHETGPGHPERSARLVAIREAIERDALDCRAERVALESADDRLLELVHDAAHLRRVHEACESGEPTLDSMDTAICADSDRVARLAAGSLVALCRRVARGELSRGFAAIRPPGHHAERDLAMGFCLFNNVAIAARYLREHEGVARVLIVDWDVHHGNGTQHLFEQDPSIFFFSLHQWPLYPGTGAAEERGVGAGLGTTLNCPLAPGAGDAEFLFALREVMLPAALDFRPEFVLVSAGFDAHYADPLANLEVSTEAYGEATDIVCDLADRVAAGRVVSTLEGGYDLRALGESVALHLRRLQRLA
ncbi:MAG TPA: histone deacetylase [Candidatus Polarisedimenticolaceae bacterium]|nr:histone deacetylase [Candidatus Polarisedimenticolaceae bacterium]